MEEVKEELDSISGPFFTDERFRKTVLQINRERILKEDYANPVIDALESANKLKGKDYLYVLTYIREYCSKKIKEFLSNKN